MKQLADYLRAQADDLESFDTSIADASLDRATLRRWASEVDAMEGRLNDAYAEGRKDEAEERKEAIATLRDGFAAAALQALLARIDAVSGDYVTNAKPVYAARDSYKFADAMLQARAA